MPQNTWTEPVKDFANTGFILAIPHRRRLKSYWQQKKFNKSTDSSTPPPGRGEEDGTD